MRTVTENAEKKKIFFALGTVNTLTYFNDSYEKTVNEAVNRVRKLHDIFSAFDENSDIGRINNNAGIAPVKVSDETLYLISSSIMYSELTDGAFDITTRVLSKIWRSAVSSGCEPLKYEIEKAVRSVNYKDIIIDKNKKTVMLRKKGQEIDLGAIAKGFAADEVKKIFESHGIKNAIINLGGTVITIGEKTVGLQNPFKNTGVSFGKLKLKDKVIVSSGTYEQCALINKKFVHHIVDTKTGCPARTDLKAVTLVGDNAEELDVLSTAVLIKGIKNGMELLKAGNIEAVFVTDEGNIYATHGLKNNLILQESES